MVNWRIVAVGLALGMAAWLIGCEGEKAERTSNSQEQDSIVRIARMKAEVDAERAAARRATTQPGGATAVTPLPIPTTLPAYRPEPTTPEPAPAVAPEPTPAPATPTDNPEPTETPVEPSGGG